MEAIASLDALGPSHWHVTLAVAGSPVPTSVIRAGLERLAAEHPFLLDGRYTSDRAEVRYWEQGASIEEVTALAVNLWSEHEISAGLPDWTVVGVSVVDRMTYHQQGGPDVVRLGRIAPL